MLANKIRLRAGEGEGKRKREEGEGRGKAIIIKIIIIRIVVIIIIIIIIITPNKQRCNHRKATAWVEEGQKRQRRTRWQLLQSQHLYLKASYTSSFRAEKTEADALAAPAEPAFVP